MGIEENKVATLSSYGSVRRITELGVVGGSVGRQDSSCPSGRSGGVPWRVNDKGEAIGPADSTPFGCSYDS